MMTYLGCLGRLLWNLALFAAALLLTGLWWLLLVSVLAWFVLLLVFFPSVIMLPMYLLALCLPLQPELETQQNDSDLPEN
ncbi:MAG: hypothetical protein JJU30_13560 [Alkalimonas sp.]|nr:hypothetical protein [Alkalimonas sp.]